MCGNSGLAFSNKQKHVGLDASKTCWALLGLHECATYPHCCAPVLPLTIINTVFLPCGVLDSIAHITRHLYTFTLRFVLMLMTQEFLDLGYISLICITTSLTVAFRRVPVPLQWFPLQKPVIFLCSASSRPKNHIYLVFRIYLVFLLGPSCLHAVIFPYSLNPFMIKMCNPLTCNATLGGGKLFWTVFLYSFYRLMNYFTRLDALFNLDLLVRCQLT